jgi:chloramphenicol 3-O-phosphotransferase
MSARKNTLAVPSSKFIVILQGVSNSGKSKILDAINKLVNDYFIALPEISLEKSNYYTCIGKNILKKKLMKKDGGTAKDYKIVYGLNYKEINFNIGIATGGDTAKIINDAMDLFEKGDDNLSENDCFWKENGCDLILIASKSKGESYDALDLRKSGYKCYTLCSFKIDDDHIPKDFVDNYAKQIFEIIFEWIDIIPKPFKKQ